MSFFFPLLPPALERREQGWFARGSPPTLVLRGIPRNPYTTPPLPSAEEMCYQSFACGHRASPAPAYAGTGQDSVQIFSAPRMH